VHDFANAAKLGIMPRPRGGDWLEEEIIKFKKQNIGIWVSLLEQHEINELGLRNQQTLCSKHELEYINVPIVDRSIPEKGSKIDSLIDSLYQKLQTGHSVVIHCRMGIGRSSIIAGCILLKAGFKTNQIIQKITVARGLKVPDTDQQIQWLKNREKG
jgi:protein-tyrosine phosphatase